MGSDGVLGVFREVRVFDSSKRDGVRAAPDHLA
jgi:hypothetical protein